MRINHASGGPCRFRDADCMGKPWENRNGLQIKTIRFSVTLMLLLEVVMWKLCEFMGAEMEKPLGINEIAASP